MENILHLCGDIAASPVPSHESHGIVFYTFPLSVLRLSGAEDLPNIIAPEVMLRRFSEGDRIRIFGQVRSFSRRTENGSHLIISAWAKSIDSAPDEPYDNRIRISGTIARPPVYRCTPYGREITDIMLKCCRPILPRTVSSVASSNAVFSEVASPAESPAMDVSDPSAKSVPVSSVPSAAAVSPTPSASSFTLPPRSALSSEAVGGFTGYGSIRTRYDYIPCVTWGSVARHCAGLETGTEVEFTGRLQSRPYTKIIEGMTFNRVAYEVSVAELKT